MEERQNSAEPPTRAGEATLDLTRRRFSPIDTEHPAVAEARIRSRSRHLIIGGSALTVITFAAAVIWHAGFGHFLPAVYIVPVYAASCGAILLGCLEYITRHSRAQQARALQIVLQVQSDQLRLVGLLDEELQQRYFRGTADIISDMSQMQGTGTGGPVVGRAAPVAQNRNGGDVVELRRRPSATNEPHFN